MIDRRFSRRWAWPWELRRHGVLGIAQRNLGYLFEHNPRPRYSQVDDKVLTKHLCLEQGIAVPKTFTVIEHFGDLRKLAQTLAPFGEFVVKPACGSGGRGVLVVVERHDWGFLTAQGCRTSFSELRYHISTILSGLHSLGGLWDRAIVEERIVPHHVFEGLTTAGTPDVRIIVYRGVPAMAMLRLPTRASGGRANLHQGAVAAGIDLETGRTFGGVWRNRAIAAHPDTQLAIGGLTVPCWPQMLAMARALSQAVHMGYVGVDIVLDSAKGPVVLEANARPGLAVQIANRLGLVNVLNGIDAQRGRSDTQVGSEDRLVGSIDPPCHTDDALGDRSERGAHG